MRWLLKLNLKLKNKTINNLPYRPSRGSDPVRRLRIPWGERHWVDRDWNGIRIITRIIIRCSLSFNQYIEKMRFNQILVKLEKSDLVERSFSRNIYLSNKVKDQFGYGIFFNKSFKFPHGSSIDSFSFNDRHWAFCGDWTVCNSNWSSEKNPWYIFRPNHCRSTKHGRILNY